jgi:hypothetical protein
MEIAGEMQIDVLHGDDLRIAAAGGSALDAEHGAERRLAQAETTFLPSLLSPSAKPDAGGGLCPRRQGWD